MSKKPILLLVWLMLGVLITACANTAPTEDAEPSDEEAQLSDEVMLSWELETQEDDFGVPHTQITLVVEGQRYVIAERLSIVEIENSDWESYQIPQTALIACGGWYAGSGNYYYVVREEDKLHVMESFVDEGMSADEMYQYESVYEITVP